MADDTYSLQMAPYDRDRTLDWLTALVPLLLVSVFYYGWRALLLELLAVGGYLVVSALNLDGWDEAEMKILYSMQEACNELIERLPLLDL